MADEFLLKMVEGSISMLERLLPHRKGKLFVLILLGFAATDFMITITLSSADATGSTSSKTPSPRNGSTGRKAAITLGHCWSEAFLRGFHEVIWLAVACCTHPLNVVVIATVSSP